MRLFVAIDPSPVAAADLRAVVDDLHVGRASAGLATQWHVTLAFIGEVADTVTVPVTRSTDPVRLRVAGAGTFGRGRGLVLWAGIGGDGAGLRRLATRVRTELRRAHLPFDRRPLRPHLTIARPREHLDPEQVAADLAVLCAYEGPEWTVDALHVYRSDIVPTPTGPRPLYTRL